MTDIFLTLGEQPVWVTALILTLAYLFLVWGIRAFLKPAIVNIFDPLNVTYVLFTGPGIVGLFLTAYLTKNYTESFFLILLFLGVWLLIMRLAGKPRKLDLRDRMGADFQMTLLSLSMLITILNVIVNMIIPGTIPLFTEGGVYSRFDATQNSRLLSWLALGTVPMPGLIFALTQDPRIRRFAVVAVSIQVVAGFMAASKGAVLAVPFMLINAMFVAKVRNETDWYRKLRKAFVYAASVAGCAIPVYFAAIGFGGNSSALLALGVRFLGGFDQLIFASQFDLLHGTTFGPILHMNLLEYQFMPFFKSVLSATYEYSSVGQYVVEMVTGISIEGPATFPNSNLILETVLTSGRYLGMAAFVIELILFYWCRFVALRKPITPFTLVLAYGMVFTPFGVFMSGQEWITEMIVVSMTVALAVALAALANAARKTLRLKLTSAPQAS